MPEIGETDLYRKIGGSGLGLAIVKHIALAHGGRVTVAGTPGKETVFSLHLQAIKLFQDLNRA